MPYITRWSLGDSSNVKDAYLWYWGVVIWIPVIDRGEVGMPEFMQGLILANKHIQPCFGLREADASVVRVGSQEVVADCEKLIAKISGH